MLLALDWQSHHYSTAASILQNPCSTPNTSLDETEGQWAFRESSYFRAQYGFQEKSVKLVAQVIVQSDI